MRKQKREISPSKTEIDQFVAVNQQEFAELLTFLAFVEYDQFTVGTIEINSSEDIDILVKELQNHPLSENIQLEVLNYSDINITFVRDEIVKYLADIKIASGKKLVFILRGLEYSIGRSGDDPTVLQNLNYVRDAFLRSVPHPVLFCLPKYAVTRLANFAPDFWAWQSKVIYFNKEQKTKSPAQRRAARQKLIQRIVQILGFLASGLGIGVMVHHVLQGDPRTAAIIGAVTFLVTIGAITAKLFSELFNSVLDKVEERLEDKTEPLTTSIINSLENLLIEFWWKLTSDFKGKYYRQLEYTCRDYLTQGLDKDKIVKLEKVFVPLKITTKDAKSVTSRMIQEINNQARNPRKKQIWDFLAAMRNESAFRRMIILGAPGSGKTTLLRYIALTYVTNTQRKVHRQAPKLIPVLLYLRDIRQEIAKNQPPLADLITQQIKKQRIINPLNPPPDWFRDRLRHNKCLVMLDGLDEVADTKQRQQVRDWVDEQISQYPDTFFLLTSRPYGYRSAPLKQAVTTLEVKPFSLRQMQQFLHNWYLQTEIMSRAGEDDLGVREEARKQAENLIERIYNSKPLADMAINPLLLTMIATVHRRGNVLPGKRVELYKEICQVLLEKRQRAKNIEYFLTASQKQSILQQLALSLMTTNTRVFKISDTDLLYSVESQLQQVTSEITLEAFIEQIKDICGLLVEKELGVYEFAHLSFQEYLAAVEIKDINKENILLDNINNSWWHETIRLYAAQSNVTNLIRSALKNPTIDSMVLAYDCLEEGLSVDPKVRKEMEIMLEDDLESL